MSTLAATPSAFSISHLLRTTRDVVALPFRTILFVRKLLKEGCVEIETPFEVSGETFTFRTLIQPDADLLNFIPNPSLLSQPAFRKAFTSAYQAHRQAVTAHLASISHHHQLWAKLADGGLIAANTAPIVRAAYDFAFVPEWEISAVMAAMLATLSLFARRFLRRNLFRLLVKGAMLLGTRWIERKATRAASMSTT